MKTMHIEFREEQLSKRRYILKLTRHKVPGGWYVRCIHTGFGFGAGGQNESTLFLPDPEHVWIPEKVRWEMLQKEPIGGIYRLKVHNGWLLLSTCQGAAKNDDGRKYRPRLASIIFIPDPEHCWECTVIQEKDPVFGFM